MRGILRTFYWQKVNSHHSYGLTYPSHIYTYVRQWSQIHNNVFESKKSGSHKFVRHAPRACAPPSSDWSAIPTHPGNEVYTEWKQFLAIFLLFKKGTATSLFNNSPALYRNICSTCVQILGDLSVWMPKLCFCVSVNAEAMLLWSQKTCS